jgi:hypothetical protein
MQKQSFAARTRLRNFPAAKTDNVLKWISFRERERVMSEEYSYRDLAKMIDHSLLNPALKWADLEEMQRKMAIV